MGRTPGVKSNLQKSVRNNTPLKKTKPPVKISEAEDEKILIEKPYRCTRCGSRYKALKGNFSASQSSLFKGNMEGTVSYLPVCKKCLDDLFNHYAIALGDEQEALKRICIKFDIYYNESVYETARKVSSDRSRVTGYISKVNLVPHNRKTYDDTIDEERGNKINTFDDLQDVQENDEIEISKKALKLFGLGYTPEEYVILNQHYKMLKEQITDDDYIQETLIKDLCDIKVQQFRIKNRGSFDVKEYETLTKLYQSTLGSANLKPKNKDNNPNLEDTFGTWIRDIERYTPAEYHRDNAIYEDMDGIKEYVERFMFRPLRNLFTGSKDKDREFNIDNIDGEKDE